MTLPQTQIKQSQINTSLPFCLYKTDSRFFRLNDRFHTKIRFEKVETTPNRRTSSSSNVRTIRDRWGIDAHSKVDIYTSKQFKDVSEAETFSLKVINEFIKLYRYRNEDEIHIVSLNKEDLFDLTLLFDGK